MDPLSSSKQDILKDRQEASPAVVLLKSGLNCFQQGRYSEGIAYFALAREQLSPGLRYFTVELDALVQDYVEYSKAQQTFQQASESLVKAQTKQQVHAASLEKLLSGVTENTESELPSLVRNKANSSHAFPSRIDDSEGDRPASVLRENTAQVKNGDEILQAKESTALPALYFICFGRFEVKRSGQTIELCTNRNGQAILRYMVAQSKHRVSKDTLMTLLWPEDEPEVGNHKLQVAMSALRRSLNNGYVSDTGGGYILCKIGVYQLNPAVSIQTDVDEFLAFYQAGRQQKSPHAAVPYYEAGCILYKGPFLTEDLYVDWPIIQREQLNKVYLAMCSELSEHYLQTGSYEDAAKWAGAILKENHCDEVAYRQLMRINIAAGRRSEALLLYQRCERILAEELNVSPMPETISLFHTILNNESSG